MGITALAVGVTAAFMWSLVLFVMAVFVRARRQETGFGYSVLGAVLFVCIYSDYLHLPSSFRTPFLLLPGVDRPSQLFQSSVIALFVLAGIYCIRMAIFTRLFWSKRSARFALDPEIEEHINDAVAPALAFITLATCIVALFRGVYDLNQFGIITLIAALLAIYYLPALRFVFTWFEHLADSLTVAWAQAWNVLRRLLFYTILVIAHLERLRRGAGVGDSRIRGWAERRLAELRAEAEKAFVEERGRLQRLAQRLQGVSSKSKGSSGRGDD